MGIEILKLVDHGGEDTAFPRRGALGIESTHKSSYKSKELLCGSITAEGQSRANLDEDEDVFRYWGWLNRSEEAAKGFAKIQQTRLLFWLE
jgi:hypothetical protein